MLFVKIPEDGKATTINIGNELDDLYKAIECDTITMIDRVIDDEYFCIIADDNGLITGRKPVALTRYQGRIAEQLVGSLLITRIDEEGETIGLTEDDAKKILNPKNFKAIVYEDTLRPVLMLGY